jgi:3-dehydroquinate synthetase
MAAELSARLGLIPGPDLERVRKLIARAGLPVAGPALSADRMLELMAVDKKAAKGKIRFVLLDSIGRARVQGDVEPELVRKAILATMQ